MTPPPDLTPTNAAGGVATVERALSILDALTDERVTLAELSKRTGLYKSTLLRLATSLERFGYVHRLEDGAYRLGSKLLFLSTYYQKHFRTSELVPPVLRQLADELQEGASFYVEDAGHRVCLHRVDAARAVRDHVREGDRLPLKIGAAAHLIRAFSGEPGRAFDLIRKNMYAPSFGERDPETAAFACPVFSHGQRLVGALSISGPRYRIEEAGADHIVPVMFKYARSLTRTFGGNVDAPEFAAWAEIPEPAAKVRRRAPPR